MGFGLDEFGGEGVKDEGSRRREGLITVVEDVGPGNSEVVLRTPRLRLRLKLKISMYIENNNVCAARYSTSGPEQRRHSSLENSDISIDGWCESWCCGGYANDFPPHPG